MSDAIKARSADGESKKGLSDDPFGGDPPSVPLDIVPSSCNARECGGTMGN